MKKRFIYFFLLILVVLVTAALLFDSDGEALEDKAKGTIGYISDELKFDIEDKMISLKSDFFDNSDLMGNTVKELKQLSAESIKQSRNIKQWWVNKFETESSNINNDSDKEIMNNYSKYLEDSQKELQDMMSFLVDMNSDAGAKDPAEIREKLADYYNFIKKGETIENEFEQVLVKTDKFLDKNSGEIKEIKARTKKMKELIYRFLAVEDKENV